MQGLAAKIRRNHYSKHHDFVVDCTSSNMEQWDGDVGSTVMMGEAEKPKPSSPAKELLYNKESFEAWGLRHQHLLMRMWENDKNQMSGFTGLLAKFSWSGEGAQLLFPLVHPRLSRK